MLIAHGVGFAQKQISMNQAVQLAMSSNQMLRSNQLQERYAALLSEHTADMEPTLISVGGGQINSWFPDHVIAIQQNFASLKGYKSQRQLMKADLGRYVAKRMMAEKELVKEVRLCFSEYIYLQQRVQMFMLADSLYKVFQQATSMQLRWGEINKIQQLTVQSRYGVLMRQLNLLKSDLYISHLKLQWLLNTTDSLAPQEDAMALNDNFQIDTTVLNHHPKLIAAEQEIKFASGLIGLERSLLRPGWGFQYSNMTMKGSGADNKIYTYGTRFQNVTVGVSVPLFSGYRHQRILAMKVNEQVMQNEQKRIYAELKRDYFLALNSFQNANTIQRFYRDSLQGSGDELQNLMSRQLSKGDISLPEWILAFNQLLDIKSQSIDAAWDARRWYIQLLYLSNQ